MDEPTAAERIQLSPEDRERSRRLLETASAALEQAREAMAENARIVMAAHGDSGKIGMVAFMPSTEFDEGVHLCYYEPGSWECMYCEEEPPGVSYSCRGVGPASPEPVAHYLLL
jgi:hypothetical protein